MDSDDRPIGRLLPRREVLSRLGVGGTFRVAFAGS